LWADFKREERASKHPLILGEDVEERCKEHRKRVQGESGNDQESSSGLKVAEERREAPRGDTIDDLDRSLLTKGQKVSWIDVAGCCGLHKQLTLL
jgi:hypothetical protein